MPAIQAIERIGEAKMQEQILMAMEKMPMMNLTKEEILAKLMAKDHDNITTTYYLLLKRFQRMEEEAWLDSQGHRNVEDDEEDDEEEEARADGESTGEESFASATLKLRSSSFCPYLRF